MDINTLRTMFPKTRKNAAITGNIPVAYFEENEKEIRKVIRAEGYRVMYRGPRVSNKQSSFSMTCRCDATSVLLYRK